MTYTIRPYVDEVAEITATGPEVDADIAIIRRVTLATGETFD